MFEESSIANSLEMTNNLVYRSIQIPVNECITECITESISKPFKAPILPFYWKLNNLSEIINIKNPETFIYDIKSFIREQNILFELNENNFICSYFDNETSEIINFHLYFWSEKELTSNQLIFEFNCINRYNFNNIFRIYEIYNSFRILFGLKPIHIKFKKYNENSNLLLEKHINKISSSLSIQV